MYRNELLAQSKRLFCNLLFISITILIASCSPSLSQEEQIIRAISASEIETLLPELKDRKLVDLANNRIELLGFIELLKVNSPAEYSSYQSQNPDSPFIELIKFIEENHISNGINVLPSYKDTSYIHIFHEDGRMDDVGRDFFMKAFENYFTQSFSPFLVKPIFLSESNELANVESLAILLQTRAGAIWHFHEETNQAHNPKILNMNGSLSVMNNTRTAERYSFDFETSIEQGIISTALAKSFFNQGNDFMDNDEMQRFWNYFLIESLGEGNKNPHRTAGNKSFGPVMGEFINEYYSPIALLLQFLTPESGTFLRLNAYQHLSREGLVLSDSFSKMILSFPDFDSSMLSDEFYKDHPIYSKSPAN